jgi:GTP-binding protein HflX
MNFEDVKLNSQSKATLVSVTCPSLEGHGTTEETQASFTELRELLRTLGISSGSEHIQHKKKLESGTILGKGKLQEIAKLAKNEGSDLLVFDIELTASQVRNIKKLTDLDVIDRVYVILEIFAQHAQTKEAKIQIEIARLEYLLPRLSTLWTHFTRQKGGVGLKGEGEQQLELDRRMIRERIESYKKQLGQVVKSRIEQRKRRQNKAITAALIGYTNAGKSSLMNRMCRVNVLEEDKLFATLDSTFRMLNPDTKPPMILIDTVGFISNLPNTLVTGFRTTLESAIEADLLIIVVDLSDANYKKHLEVTHEVLKELNLEDKDKLIVFNKMDKVEDQFLGKLAAKQYPNSFQISSHNPDDIEKLRSHIIQYFLDQQAHYDLFVPYALGDVHSKIKANTNIIKMKTHENGIFYRIRVPDFIFGPLDLNEFILGPQDPRISELES